MKKLIVVLVAVVSLFAAMSVSGASAAPAEAAKVGPYEGVFHGTVYAPNGSKAAMSLDMTHRGSVVEGTVFLGEGLSIDAGICGATTIPSGAINAAGKSSASNPNMLTAGSTFEVQGITVNVDLASKVSGDTLNAEAKIDLPWICGGDPVLTGTLQRA